MPKGSCVRDYIQVQYRLSGQIMARHPDYEREELLTQAVMSVAQLKG